MTKHLQKFRPSFTLPQINYILQLLSTDQLEATANLKESVRKQLRLITLKAEAGLLNPSHTVREQISVDDALSSPTELRAVAFERWKLNPDICTEKEIKMVQTYRYENDLMSAEEEEAFENTGH